MDQTHSEPKIYIPLEAATATAPDGRKLVFFTVPQLDLLIKRVLAARPKEYTYRWAFHPEHRMHVLLFEWPGGEAAGIAIPEGTGDQLLSYMVGTTEVFITVDAVQGELDGDVGPQKIEKFMRSNTIYLPKVHYEPDL